MNKKIDEQLIAIKALSLPGLMYFAKSLYIKLQAIINLAKLTFSFFQIIAAISTAKIFMVIEACNSAR